MSYINYINRLSSDIKKVIDENSQIQDVIKRSQDAYNLMPNFNKNSIGYKLKYIFEIDKEIKSPNNFLALQIIMNYLLEKFIENNESVYFKYDFYIYNENLYLSIFHNNKNYLESYFDNLINFISSELDTFSMLIRSKFLDLATLSLRIKIKIIQKECPILIDILCNTIKEKRKYDQVNEIVDSIIIITRTNDITILKDIEAKYTTLKSEENTLDFLTQFNIENKRKKVEDETIHENVIKKKREEQKENEENFENNKKEDKQLNIFNNVETINDNIKQLFWHTDEPKIYSNKYDWLNSILFVIVLATVIYKVPFLAQKIKDFTKSNSVIDNILDLATDDLTTTKTRTSQTINQKAINKLEPIKEMNEDASPVEPAEPAEPSDEDIGIITRNIIKNFNEMENSAYDLKSIENRLRVILEETDTKT